MRAETQEKCRTAAAMIEKGASRKDALKKLDLSTATYHRFRTLSRRAKPTHVLPHSHAEDDFTEASNASAMTANRSHSPSIANNVQIALYEQEIIRLRIVNKKLSEIIAEIMN